jgi:hypothetical protein
MHYVTLLLWNTERQACGMFMPEGFRIIGSVRDGTVCATALVGFTFLSWRCCKVHDSFVVLCNIMQVVSCWYGFRIRFANDDFFFCKLCHRGRPQRGQRSQERVLSRPYTITIYRRRNRCDSLQVSARGVLSWKNDYVTVVKEWTICVLSFTFRCDFLMKFLTL